jgi:hypothetical protein
MSLEHLLSSLDFVHPKFNLIEKEKYSLQKETILLRPSLE